MCDTRGVFSFTRLAAGKWRYLASLLILALLTTVCLARDEGPDDRYVVIYKIIQKADTLSEGGKTAQARTNYLEAREALTAFQREFPYWNTKLVAYRLGYVTQKLAPPAEAPAATAGSASTNASQDGAGAKAAASGSAIQVKLLEPGAEPRKALRLHPAAGDKQALEMTLKMAMESKVGEAGGPSTKLPGMKLTLETTVKSVADNGDIAFDIVVGNVAVLDEPGAAPEMVEAMKMAFAGVKGAAGAGSISSRGFGAGVEFKLPEGADAQARQLMEQMKDFYSQLAPPLPEEAVGVGAKWEVKMPIKGQGMTLNQTATYEVVSLEGEQLETKSATVQEAANQKVQNPAMPRLKADLIKMSSRGTGERTFDLTKLMPTAGAGTMHSESSMSMTVQNQKQVITSKLDVTLSFESK